MKSFPSDLLTEIIKRIHTRTYLVKLQFSHPLYLTPFSEKILHENQWYSPRKIEFKGGQISMLARADHITLEANNSDRFFTYLAESERIEGSPVYIYEAYLDLHAKIIGSWVFFFGYVDRYRISPRRASLMIYNHMIKFKTPTPRYIHGAACRFEFKKKSSIIIGTDSNQYTCIFDHIAVANNRPVTGAFWRMFWTLGGSGGSVWQSESEYLVEGCNYTGAETSCDQSYDRCIELGNQANFGGFRWQPYLADKDLWWGRGKQRESM